MSYTINLIAVISQACKLYHTFFIYPEQTETLNDNITVITAQQPRLSGD